MTDHATNAPAPKRCELCGADLEPSSCVDNAAHKLGHDIWAMLSDPRHGYATNSIKLYVMMARVYGRHTTRQIGRVIGKTPVTVSKLCARLAAEYPGAASVLKGRRKT